MKIVKTQYSFLSPVFGRSSILGGPADDTTRGSAEESSSSSSEPMTELLKSVALDAVQELIRQFNVHYIQMFEPLILQSGISDFFDNAITQRIQSKARYILNVRLDLSKSDLFHTSLDFMQTGPSKTAFQVSQLNMITSIF